MPRASHFERLSNCPTLQVAEYCGAVPVGVTIKMASKMYISRRLGLLVGCCGSAVNKPRNWLTQYACIFLTAS